MRVFHIYNCVKKAVAALCAIALVLCCAAPVYPMIGPAPGRTTEYISNNYIGSRDYLDVLFNIDFQDIGSSWARDAIYESGALGIVKGYGAGVYNGGAVMTKGQAIALALRAGGYESAAQLAGEAYEAARRAGGGGQSGAEETWIIGSLKVAADLGLISAEDYEAAIYANDVGAGTGTGTGANAGAGSGVGAVSSFRSGDAAQRQEFAYWLALALDIPPVRGQEAVFTKYIDWQTADVLYVPYIEAILREKIMSGELAGRFSPRDGLTREQAAQVIKNASKFICARNGYTDTTGTIEKIATDAAAAPEGANAVAVRAVYHIRNQIGRLDVITTHISISDSAGPASAERRDTGLVVNAGGTLEDETALRVGDRIRYISSRNRYPGYPDEIRYIEILAKEAPDRAYVLAQIDNIDHINRRISFTQIFPLEYPDATQLRRAAEAPQELLRYSAEYIYSEIVAVRSNGAYIDVTELAVGMVVIIGVENFKNLFYIETVRLGYHLGEPGIARGVIEENNPVLGFISMYSESGDTTGIRSLGKDGERPELMIYSYVDPRAVEVLKDGADSTIDALSAGDSAFVRFDGSGMLTAVGAVTNYKARFGTIISVLGGSFIVRFDDESGTQYNLELGAGVLYFKDYKLASKDALAPGASVRVLLRDLAGTTEVREITVMHEGDRGLVGNIYKAVLSRFDETSKQAVIYNVEKLVKGRWERTDRKGFDSLNYNADTRIYVGEAQMTPVGANKLLRENDVYIAVKNDYGGVEVAAQISIRGADDKEQLYDSVVRNIRRPTVAFGLVNGPADIAAGDWSIVVKDGLLVSGAVIEQDDLVYVVASREDATGRLRADVVEIGDRASNNGIRVYRGRISRVSLNKDFTLESFSELDLGGTEWKYANTPKTFSLTFDTLFLTAGGVTSTDMFDGRGLYDYTDPPRTVYVLSDGVDALAISTAPYGIENIRGTVVSLYGQEFDEDGKIVTGPSSATVAWVSYYDRAKYEWAQKKSDTIVLIAPYTLIIKNGEPITPSEIQKSDAIRVITVGNPATDAAVVANIIIIEN